MSNRIDGERVFADEQEGSGYGGEMGKHTMSDEGVFGRLVDLGVTPEQASDGVRRAQAGLVIETAYRMLADAGLENGGLIAGREAALAASRVTAYLDKRFPERETKACPVCGRSPNLPCHEPYWTEGHGSGFRNRVIPHDARMVDFMRRGTP